ncbi:hypothetical protein ACLEIY_00625 [Acetobacter tropicalis]
MNRLFKNETLKKNLFMEAPDSIAVDVALPNTTPLPEKIQETHFF